MSLDLVQEFDFGTPGDYTPGGDCEISGGVLQLESGFLLLNQSVRKWENLMETVASGDHEGDLKPYANTLHLVLDGDGDNPQPLEWPDYLFQCWLYHAQGGLLTDGKQFSCYSRYYSDVGGTQYIESLFRHSGRDDIGRFRHYTSDTAMVVDDTQIGPDFPKDLWRGVAILVRDDELQFRIGAQRDYWYRHHVLTDMGSHAFYMTDPARSWFVGGNDGTPGHPSAKPCPFICQRKYGSCELNEASAWTAPDDIESLNWIAWETELVWLPSHADEFDAPYFSRITENFQYNHFDGGSWSGWLDLPAYGDMSGVSIGAGDKLRWRFNDGSGYGLDNGEDPRWQPQIKRVLMSYTVSGELAEDSPTAHRRNAVQAGPRKGAFD